MSRPRTRNPEPYKAGQGGTAVCRTLPGIPAPCGGTPVLQPVTSTCWLVPLVAVSLVVDPLPAAAQDRVKVTVVAVLASERHDKVDKELTCIAREVRKKDPQFK